MRVVWKKGFDQSKVTENNYISLAQFAYAVFFEENYEEEIASGRSSDVVIHHSDFPTFCVAYFYMCCVDGFAGMVLVAVVLLLVAPAWFCCCRCTVVCVGCVYCLLVVVLDDTRQHEAKMAGLCGECYQNGGKNQG